MFTADLERGARFAQRLETGMAHGNDQPNNPLGGEKNCGIGRFGGGWAVEAFTTEQRATLPHVPRHFPRDARAIQGPWAGG